MKKTMTALATVVATTLTAASFAVGPAEAGSPVDSHQAAKHSLGTKSLAKVLAADGGRFDQASVLVHDHDRRHRAFTREVGEGHVVAGMEQHLATGQRHGFQMWLNQGEVLGRQRAQQAVATGRRTKVDVQPRCGQRHREPPVSLSQNAKAWLGFSVHRNVRKVIENRRAATGGMECCQVSRASPRSR